jgi:NAD(P)-dependent dehydrogenase (short-subunit alcohol dehydrogenase family)
MRVSGKVALVTGAFGGIGKASAEALAREGAAVVAADIKPSSPSYAGEGVEYIRLDVRNDAEWKVLVANIVARHGRIDIMVNAAGITAYQDLHEVDDSVWHDVVAVNQTALM